MKARRGQDKPWDHHDIRGPNRPPKKQYRSRQAASFFLDKLIEVSNHKGHDTSKPGINTNITSNDDICRFMQICMYDMTYPNPLNILFSNGGMNIEWKKI